MNWWDFQTLALLLGGAGVVLLLICAVLCFLYWLGHWD
jgi:hypothetical protein